MLTYIGLLIVTYRVLYIGLGAVALQNASCLRAVDREREVVPEELRRLSEGQAHEERSLADEIVGEDLHLGARVAHPIERERTKSQPFSRHALAYLVFLFLSPSSAAAPIISLALWLLVELNSLRSVTSPSAGPLVRPGIASLNTKSAL